MRGAAEVSRISLGLIQKFDEFLTSRVSLFLIWHVMRGAVVESGENQGAPREVGFSWCVFVPVTVVLLWLHPWTGVFRSLSRLETHENDGHVRLPLVDWTTLLR